MQIRLTVSLYVTTFCARFTASTQIFTQVNYGGLLLQALLEYWPRPYAVEEESDVDAGVSDRNR